MIDWLFNRHLENDESLQLIVHKHKLIGLIELTPPIIVLIISWVLLYIAPVQPIALIVLGADIAILIWMLRNFLDYYLDAWIITDKSVIDVEWHGWFHRQSTRIDYSSIEGVSYEIQGILGTLCRFGSVTLEKVSSGAKISIENVPNPRDVESVILECQNACLRTKSMKDSSAVQDILSEIVAERMHLKEAEDSEVKLEEEEEVEV